MPTVWPPPFAWPRASRVGKIRGMSNDYLTQSKSLRCARQRRATFIAQGIALGNGNRTPKFPIPMHPNRVQHYFRSRDVAPFQGAWLIFFGPRHPVPRVAPWAMMLHSFGVLWSFAKLQAMGEVGLEPTSLAAQDPKSCVSANFTTRPIGNRCPRTSS